MQPGIDFGLELAQRQHQALGADPQRGHLLLDGAEQLVEGILEGIHGVDLELAGYRL